MWRGTDRTRSQMILTEYQYDYQKKNSRSVYLVRHNSRIQQTVLEQFLTVDRDSFGRFMPTIELKDFPEQLSDRESMLKLADWLHRLPATKQNMYRQSGRNYCLQTTNNNPNRPGAAGQWRNLC